MFFLTAELKNPILPSTSLGESTTKSQWSISTSRSSTQNQEERKKKSQKSSSNVTRTLIAIAFLCIAGNLPYSVFYISRKVMNIKPNSSLNFLYLVSQWCIYSIAALKFTVLYIYNSPFRSVFNSFFYKSYR